jgi:putative hydrolase of HD superfamily
MSDLTPEQVVQKQLDVYNARDLEGLLAIYSSNAQLFEHPSTLICEGAEALRIRYSARFQEPNLHATLVNRIVMNNIVIDYERITRTFPEGAGTLEMTMIYEVQGQHIVKAWSIVGEKTLD